MWHLVSSSINPIDAKTCVLKCVYRGETTVALNAEVVCFLVMFFHVVGCIQPLNNPNQLFETTSDYDAYQVAWSTILMVPLVMCIKLRAAAKVFIAMNAVVVLRIFNQVFTKILERPVIYVAIMADVVFLRVALVSRERIVRAKIAIAAVTISHMRVKGVVVVVEYNSYASETCLIKWTETISQTEPYKGIGISNSGRPSLLLIY